MRKFHGVFKWEGGGSVDYPKSLLGDLERIEEIHIEKNPFRVFSKPEIVEALKLIEKYSEEFKI